MAFDWLTGIISLAATNMVTGFASWFFTRRSYNQDVKNKEINNFDASLSAYKDMYDEMIQDLKESLSEVKEENKALKAQRETLNQEIERLKAELDETRKQVMTLTNFVLGNALKNSDGAIPVKAVNDLKEILE